MYFKFFLAIFSFLCALALIGYRLWFNRKLSRQVLYKGIILSRPFFCDFKPYVEAGFNKLGLVRPPAFLKKHFEFCKKHSASFCRYMEGRHAVEKNGCKGYWRKVNGYKNNGKGNSGDKNNTPG